MGEAGRVRRKPLSAPRESDRRSWRRALVVAAALGLPLTAASAQDTAFVIDQSLATLERQAAVRPERVLLELGEQRAQIETLAEREPDNPVLPRLIGRLDRLEARLKDPLAAEVVRPPGPVSRELDALREQLRLADGALMSRDQTRAAELVQTVEAALARLLRTRAEEIPQGSVAVFVLEERLDVLKRQLGEAETGASEAH